MILDQIPASMKSRAQWILWRQEYKGRPIKRPYSVRGTAFLINNPTGMVTFTQVLKAFKSSSRYDGLGFVFLAEDPFVGIDLDWKGSQTMPSMARKVIERFNSYSELSPSGQGAHIIIKGKLPADARKRTSIGGLNIEVYTQLRFFTVTGRRIHGAEVENRQDVLDSMYDKLLRQPAQTKTRVLTSSVSLSDNEILQRAFRARNGNRVKVLFNGDTSGYPSASEADLALAAYLAFYTGPNPGLLERLMRASNLYREKWDETRNGNTWIANTVRFAISTQRNFWRRSA